MTFLVAVVIAGIAVVVAALVGRRLGHRLAGPLVVLAMTPLVPNVPIAMGLSTDDVLPVTGVLLLLQSLRPWPRRPSLPGPRWLLWIALGGTAALLLAGLVSSLLVADHAVQALRLLLRSTGRFALLAVIAIAVGLAVSRLRRGSELVATAIAAVGTLQAAFGIFVFLVPLPDRIGLGSKGPNSVLFGEIPGRVTGTLGLGANFVGAILMVSVLVTVGLAMAATENRHRWAWLAAALMQFVTLTLTFSRAPIAIAAVGVVLIVILARRPMLALPFLMAGGVLVLLTPIAARFLSDATNRLALWYSAVLLMLDNPVSGVGAGRMLTVMQQWPERYMLTPAGRAIASAHNVVLLAGAELGVLGAIGALLLHAAVVMLGILRLLQARAAGDTVRLGGALAILGFEVQGVVNNLFTVGVTSVTAAILVGAFLLADAVEDVGENRPIGREQA